MFASRIALAALALVNVALAGAPPACLLGAIQGLPNPADMKAVCGTYQTSVTGNLSIVCSGDDVKSAYSAYSATCSLNGVKIKAIATSSSAAAASTDASSASATATAKTTGTTAGTTTGTSMTTATVKATSSAATKTGTSTATASGADASGTGVVTSGATTAAQPVALMVSGLVALGVANLLLL